MACTTQPFGTTSAGLSATLYTLKNASGMTVSLTDLGACMVSLRVPDGHGAFPDVLLGYDGAAGYEVNKGNHGAVVGRSANRIAGASFEIDGVTHTLTATQFGNNLHSGPDMWFRRLWKVLEATEDRVTFELVSPDGDQGYPGEVTCQVTYTLTDNAIDIAYRAESDQRTVINLTNHAYFNLNGHAAGNVLDHELTIYAQTWTPSDEESIPTGEIASVTGTDMDFTTPHALGERIDSSYEPIARCHGYDHNYVIDGEGYRHAAHLFSPETGISMDVYTDAPGMQLYTSNGLKAPLGKDGARYSMHDAVCLETQFYPDAIHKPDWPQPVFGPGAPYNSRTTYAFRTNG